MSKPQSALGARVSVPSAPHGEGDRDHTACDAQQNSREQFEQRTHKRLIDILSPSPRTVDALTKLDLPAGVEIEIKLAMRPKQFRREEHEKGNSR